MRALIVAALIALPSVTDAARLTTPIVDNGSNWEGSCRLSYFGQIKNLPVKVSFIGYADQPGVVGPVSRSFKLGPANRAVAVKRSCDAVGGDLACEKFRCVFEVPNNVSKFDFVGAACSPSPTGPTAKYCAPAQ